MTEYESFGGYEPSEERSKVGMALTFLFIGLGIGALSALLFAPKTGKQLRRSLRRRYEDAREVIDDWSEQAGDVLERGTEFAKEARDRGADFAERAKKKVAPMAEKLRR